MHAKLLLLRGETPLLDGARSFVDRVRALEEPIREFQIIGVIFISQAKSGQSPSVFQIRIERERVVFDGQGSAVAENLHGPRKVMRERGFEVLAPARSVRRISAEGK